MEKQRDDVKKLIAQNKYKQEFSAPLGKYVEPCLAELGFSYTGYCTRSLKSDGQEISSIEWQELENESCSLF